MKENKTKKMVNYSINKTILKKFDEISMKRAINKSALIELLIKEWIEKTKDNK